MWSSVQSEAGGESWVSLCRKLVGFRRREIFLKTGKKVDINVPAGSLHTAESPQRHCFFVVELPCLFSADLFLRILRALIAQVSVSSVSLPTWQKWFFNHLSPLNYRSSADLQKTISSTYQAIFLQFFKYSVEIMPFSMLFSVYILSCWYFFVMLNVTENSLWFTGVTVFCCVSLALQPVFGAILKAHR